ncbi:hypothetical protein J6590_056951 [Homalodisca vitripennis]|nr:hypothetical protein J6590_056951 [Homalodisca vitripennis]
MTCPILQGMEGTLLVHVTRGNYQSSGGVVAFAKSHLTVSVLYSPDNSRLGRPEYMIIDISCNGIHVLVYVCYRATGLGFHVELEHSLINFMPPYCHVIVMGGFNCNLLGRDNYDKTNLTNLFCSCYTPHTTADTLLDVMAVADPDRVVHHGQYSAPGLFST